MSNDLAARLIVQLIDNLSGPAEKASKSLKGIKGAADSINANKATGEIDKLAAALKRAEVEGKKLGEFRNSLGGLQKARAEFRATQANVEALAKEVNAARLAETRWAEARERLGKRLGGDMGKQIATQYKTAKQAVAELEAQYKRAQRDVKSASRDFLEQKDAVSGARKALQEMGVGLNELSTAEKRAKQTILETTKAIKEQMSASANHPAGNGGAGGRGGMWRRVRGSLHGSGVFAGPIIAGGTWKAVEAGADQQHEVATAQTAGVPGWQLSDFVKQSGRLQSKYLNVPRSSIIATGKELRSVLANPDEASDLLETTIRAKSALDASDPSGNASENLQFAVKAAEIMGKGKDKAEFTKFMDSFVRAKQVMGNLITPEGLRDFAKYTKASGSLLSDRFISTTGTSLSMEVGGSTAGKYIDQFVKQITGGFQGNLHAAAKEFVSLGLADKSDFETTKTGEIKGMKHGHSVKGSKLAATDPDQWIYSVLMPAMTKAGITDPADITQEIRRLFPNSNAADLVAKIVSQKTSFDNHAGLYPNAQGMAAADSQNGDPYRALSNLTTSLSNFAATVTSPSMEKAAGVMNTIAQGAGNLAAKYADWAKNNPGMANAAGFGAMGAGVASGAYLTYGLFQLGTAGPALTSAAVSLEAAAVSLRAASGVGGATTGLTTAGAGTGLWAAAKTGFKGVLGLAGLQYLLTNGPLDDQVLANGQAATGKARSRYGDKMVSAARAKYWGWWRMNQGLDQGALDDEELVQRLTTSRMRAREPAEPKSPLWNWPVQGDGLKHASADAEKLNSTLEKVGSQAVAPKVDTASLQAAITMLQKIQGMVSSINSQAAGVASAAGRLHADNGLGGM